MGQFESSRLETLVHDVPPAYIQELTGELARLLMTHNEYGIGPGLIAIGAALGASAESVLDLDAHLDNIRTAAILTADRSGLIPEVTQRVQ